MTSSKSGYLHRDHDVCALFALALEGHASAEDELRELAAQDDDGAAELLCVLAYSDALVHADAPRPADVAATDQVIAAVLEIVLGPAHRPMSPSSR